MLSTPLQDEFASFYHGYVQLVGQEPLLDQLRQNGQQTVAMFRQLSEDQFDYRYEAGKWSVKEVLGHMIDAEWVFAGRALRISRGESQPLPGFDQNSYIDSRHFAQLPSDAVIDAFEGIRHASLTLAQLITPAQFLRRGTASGSEVSTRALFYLMAGHEIHHMNVLRERYGLK